MRHAAVAGREETLAVTPRKFPLCTTNSHLALQTVGLAVLIRSTGPVSQNLVERELGVHFPLPGRSRESRRVRRVRHRDGPSSTRQYYITCAHTVGWRVVVQDVVCVMMRSVCVVVFRSL